MAGEKFSPFESESETTSLRWQKNCPGQKQAGNDLSDHRASSLKQKNRARSNQCFHERPDKPVRRQLILSDQNSYQDATAHIEQTTRINQNSYKKIKFYNEKFREFSK